MTCWRSWKALHEEIPCIAALVTLHKDNMQASSARFRLFGEMPYCLREQPLIVKMDVACILHLDEGRETTKQNQLKDASATLHHGCTSSSASSELDGSL